MLTDVEINLKDKFLVLVKPEIHISSKEAYLNVKPRQERVGVREVVEEYPLDQWKEFLINDFEESIFNKYPGIKEIREYFYSRGAKYASMSGSGSSVFGIFEKPVDLKKDFVKQTYWSGVL